MEMRHRTTIAWLLTAVCMIMLTAAVVPHHHHHHLLCLQHEVADEAGHADDDGGCHACCIAHFQPLRGQGISAKPHFAFTRILFHLTDLDLLLQRDETDICAALPPYCERLHTRKAGPPQGLRAPPLF